MYLRLRRSLPNSSEQAPGSEIVSIFCADACDTKRGGPGTNSRVIVAVIRPIFEEKHFRAFLISFGDYISPFSLLAVVEVELKSLPGARKCDDFLCRPVREEGWRPGSATPRFSDCFVSNG